MPCTLCHWRRDRYENVTLFWVETSVSGTMTSPSCKSSWQPIAILIDRLSFDVKKRFSYINDIVLDLWIDQYNWYLQPFICSLARQTSRSSFKRRTQWREKGPAGAGAGGCGPASGFPFPHRQPDGMVKKEQTEGTGMDAFTVQYVLYNAYFILLKYIVYGCFMIWFISLFCIVALS